MRLQARDELAPSQCCDQTKQTDRDPDHDQADARLEGSDQEDDQERHVSSMNGLVDSVSPQTLRRNVNNNEQIAFSGIDADFVRPVSSAPCANSTVLRFSYEPRLWEYRNEGNQNLTISSYVLRKVLRLRKASPAKCNPADGKLTVPNGVVSSNSVVPSSVCGDSCALRTPAAVIRGHEFARAVMLPLLTPENKLYPWVQPGELVFISPEVLCELARDVENSRPSYRLHRSLDPSNFYATVAPDVTGFSAEIRSVSPVFSFEIKPKRGFCTSRHVSEGSSGELPAFVCRYCLKQTSYASSASSVPNYCPLRLFSGKDGEMSEAVKSLLTCPMNNLKLFVDGQRVPFGGKHSTCPLTENDWKSFLKNAMGDGEGAFLERISRLLIRALTDDGTKRDGLINGHLPSFSGDQNVDEEGSQGAIKCAGRMLFGTNSRLPPNSVLGRLLGVQMLDKAGPAECRRALNQLRSRNLPGLEAVLGSGPFSCPLWTRAVSLASAELNGRKRVDEDTVVAFSATSAPWDVVPSDPGLSSILEKIMRFQISASSSDCSVFCTFQRIPAGEEFEEEIAAQEDGTFVLEMDGILYACRISIVDVDPKPPGHIEKYIEDTKRGFAALAEKGWLPVA